MTFCISLNIFFFLFQSRSNWRSLNWFCSTILWRPFLNQFFFFIFLVLWVASLIWTRLIYFRLFMNKILTDSHWIILVLLFLMSIMGIENSFQLLNCFTFIILYWFKFKLFFMNLLLVSLISHIFILTYTNILLLFLFPDVNWVPHNCLLSSCS